MSAFGCGGGHVRNPYRNSFIWRLSCVIGRVVGGWWMRADSLQLVVSALWKKRYCNKCCVIEANKIILRWWGICVHLLSGFISETKTGISITFGFQRQPRRLQLLYFGSCQSSLWSFCRTYSSPKLSIGLTKMDTLHIGVELSKPSNREVHVNTVKFDIEPLSVYRSLLRYIEGVDKSKCHLYSRINSTKSPAAGAGNVSGSRLMSHVGRVREVVCPYVCVFLKSEQWKCQYSSVYVAVTVTWLK